MAWSSVGHHQQQQRVAVMALTVLGSACAGAALAVAWLQLKLEAKEAGRRRGGKGEEKRRSSKGGEEKTLAHSVQGVVLDQDEEEEQVAEEGSFASKIRYPVSPSLLRSPAGELVRGRTAAEELKIVFGENESARSPRPTKATPARGQTVDLLVHNVSHADLAVSMAASREGREAFLGQELEVEDTVLARPRFSKFAQICAELRKAATARPAFVRTGRRELSEPAYRVYTSSSSSRGIHKNTPRGRRPSLNEATSMAAGIRLDPRLVPGWTSERVRKDMKVRRGETADISLPDALWPRRIYLPVLAVATRAWLDHVCEPDSKRVVLLVTGTGTPRDDSIEDPRGNSTEIVAEFMTLLVGPLVDEVRTLHSESNIFRYDENISFVRNELEPAVARVRDSVVVEKREHSSEKTGRAHNQGAETQDPDRGAVSSAFETKEPWAKRFRVAVTSADGAPARVAAIQRSLRIYRPTGIHVWQPKTFWEFRVVSTDDVEVLPFSDVETFPAQPTAELEPGSDLYRVVQAMRANAEKFRRLVDDNTTHTHRRKNDMAAFWHRKSRTIVLAVLLVRKHPDDPGTLYSGANMEVSMPTGSLCAERNAIGSALADDLGLLRYHLKLLAVLGLNLPPDKGGAAKIVCRSTTTTPTEELNTSVPQLQKPVQPDALRASGSDSDFRRQVLKSYPKIDKDYTTTPAATSRVYEVQQHDFNPLKPCGSCAEWLKKIAAVNPDFKVLTFTDASCRGYYVESAVMY